MTNDRRVRLTDDLLRSALAREPAPDLVSVVADDVLWAAERTSQQHGVAIRLPWASDPGERWSGFGRRSATLLVAAGLVLGLVLAAAIVGAMLRPAVPVPLRSNGLVAFGSQRGDVFVMSADGTGLRTLETRPTRGLSWSPDGQRLAFWEGIGRDWQLRLFDPASGDLTTVTRFDLDRPFYPASEPLQWSADGGTVLSGQGEDLYIPGAVTIDLLTGALTEIVPSTTRARTPVWSPDRTRLAFVGQPNTFPQEGWSLYMADADGSGAGQVPLPEGSEADYWPSWSPDSRWLVVTAVRDDNFALVRVDRHGGDATLLTPWAPKWVGGSWSPDGTRIAVGTLDFETSIGGIAIMPAGGGEQRHLAEGCPWFRWAPDATAVLYWIGGCPPGPTMSLALAPIDGSSPRTLWSRERGSTGDSLDPSWQGIPR